MSRKRRSKANESRSGTAYHPRDPGIAALFPDTNVAAGTAITEDSALSFSAIFAGIRFVADTMAGLTAEIYRKREDGGRDHLPSHPLDEVLNCEMNPEMTSVVGREAVEVQKYLHGYGYAEIVRNGIGRAVELWPIETSRVTPFREQDTGVLKFRVAPLYPEQRDVVLDDSQMFRIPLLTTDGITSKGLIQRAKQSIGVAIQAETEAGAFYANGSHVGGLLSFPNNVGPDNMQKARDAFEKVHRSAKNSHRLAMLDNGATFTQIGLSPDEAQALDTRKFQVNEVSRWLGLPPHFLMMLENGGLTNVEQMTLILQKFTLRGLCVRWEQEARRKLFTGQEKDLRMQLNMDNLLRGDLPSRYTAYNVGRQGGWLSINEVRQYEGLNPLPAEQGETWLTPMNMHISMKGDPKPEPPAATQPVTKGQGATPVQSTNGPPDTPKRSLLAATRGVIADAAARMIRKECKAVLSASARQVNFIDWCEGFYAKHESQLSDSLYPAIRAHLAASGDSRDAKELADSSAKECCRESLEKLVSVAGCERREFDDQIGRLCEHWERRRAEDVADHFYSEVE